MTYKEYTLINAINSLGYGTESWSVEFFPRDMSVKDFYLSSAPADAFFRGLTLAIWAQQGDDEFFSSRAKPTGAFPYNGGTLMLYDLNEN